MPTAGPTLLTTRRSRLIGGSRAGAQQPRDRSARAGPLGVDAAPPRQLVELDDPRRAFAEGTEGEVGRRRSYGAVDMTKVDADVPGPDLDRGRIAWCWYCRCSLADQPPVAAHELEGRREAHCA